VLMRDGVIEQSGAPLDLFERPASRFVAGFLGSPQMGFVPGTLARGGDGAVVALLEGPVASLALPPGRVPASTANGVPVLIGIRPEHVSRAAGEAPAAGAARIEADIELLQPTGSRSFATFRLAGVPILAELRAHDVSRAGTRIALDIDLNRVSLFDAKTEKAL
jgi:multiple sugar transport system ATP-binding protein